MKKLFLLFPFALTLLFFAQSTYAASPRIGGCGPGGEADIIDTAIGPICTDAVDGGFITSILGIAIGLGGGIALLLMLYGIFLITTSAGIPDKLNAGRQIIESAIGGLLFIILSVVLLNLIGIKILAIPGLA